MVAEYKKKKIDIENVIDIRFDLLIGELKKSREEFRSQLDKSVLEFEEWAIDCLINSEILFYTYCFRLLKITNNEEKIKYLQIIGFLL